MLGACSSQKTHLICEGGLTRDGVMAPISDVSASLELFPALNRLVFRPGYLGVVTLDSRRQLYYIYDADDQTVRFANRERDDDFGELDRVNGEMSADAGNVGVYRLQCRETRPIGA